MEKTIEHNSSINQRIKGKFVEREVYLNMNGWVEDYQKNNECWFEEFENLYEYHCPNCGNAQQEPFDSEAQSEDFDTDYKYMCYACDKEFDSEAESEAQEMYEYWAISSFLYEDLKRLGEPVAEINNTYIWGRTCTGQAILLDSVISEICEKMEILKGQPNSWE